MKRKKFIQKKKAVCASTKKQLSLIILKIKQNYLTILKTRMAMLQRPFVAAFVHSTRGNMDKCKLI